MTFEPGDLVIFYGREFASRTIEFFTRGPSHIAIIADAKPHGLLLHESTTLNDEPCVITGKKVQGVQAHHPAERIDRYPGRVALLRLAPSWRLNYLERWRLADELRNMIGEPYDLRGALVSGTRLFKWTALMPYPDLGSVFCSELCAAMLMRIWRLPLANPSTYNPASLVRAVLRCGTYQAPEFQK